MNGGTIFAGAEALRIGALCVVDALACYERHVPERFRGSERCAPLFAWASGRLLVKGDMKSLLEHAAVAAGVHPNDIGTHSLRIGGASALWAAYKDSALVQRWGAVDIERVPRLLVGCAGSCKGCQ